MLLFTEYFKIVLERFRSSLLHYRYMYMDGILTVVRACPETQLDYSNYPRTLGLRRCFRPVPQRTSHNFCYSFTAVILIHFFLQILWSLQRSGLPIQLSFGPHAIWSVFYLSVSHFWYTDLDYGLYCLPDLEIRLMAGVNSWHRLFTLPRHLIPPLIYSEVRVCPFSDSYFLRDLWNWLLFVIYAISSFHLHWISSMLKVEFIICMFL
jgi:hypothetical protein